MENIIRHQFISFPNKKNISNQKDKNAELFSKYGISLPIDLILKEKQL